MLRNICCFQSGGEFTFTTEIPCAIPEGWTRDPRGTVLAKYTPGFIITFKRGAEWAATGKVTQKIPEDFPGAEKSSGRTFPKPEK